MITSQPSVCKKTFELILSDNLDWICDAFLFVGSGKLDVEGVGGAET